jgi:protein FrlC
MKFAYHTYAFGGRSWLPSWTLEEAIRLTAELGFEGLELAACRPHGWPWDLDQVRRGEIRKLAGDYEISFSGICPVQVNQNIASPVPEERKGTVAYFIECLQLAVDLDCSTVVFGGGWSVRPHRRDEAWGWAAEGLATVARQAERLGVVMALENINSRRADVITTSQDILQMVNEVGSPMLRTMIDLYHLHLEGEHPLEAIHRLGSSLAYAHFLDARLDNRARLAPGLGEMPLVEIISALKQVGYDGWLSVEIWGDDPFPIGRQSVKFFQDNLSGFIEESNDG